MVALDIEQERRPEGGVVGGVDAAVVSAVITTAETSPTTQTKSARWLIRMISRRQLHAML
jgi:hypothetical protein